MFTTKDMLYMRARGIRDISDLGEVSFKTLSASEKEAGRYYNIEASCNDNSFYKIYEFGINSDYLP